MACKGSLTRLFGVESALIRATQVQALVQQPDYYVPMQQVYRSDCAVGRQLSFKGGYSISRIRLAAACFFDNKCQTRRLFEPG